MSTIMVQIMDAPKTQEALHFACALARSKQTKVALVKMVSVPHISWLGTELGDAYFTDRDAQELAEYRAIAESYEVEVEVHTFQYNMLTDALAQAANYVDAQMVFAELPPSRLPFWYRFRVWLLRQYLMQRDCYLYLLEHGAGPSYWTPSVLVPAASTRHVRS
jgi:hypothetical protein